jgi:uncharacterized NAD(P)/FAD-binding protein YdhS
MTSPRAAEVIAIIGGGFSGTMVAFHLARLTAPGPVKILLFEKGLKFARGLAYGTNCDRHLLNVPAGLMSALSDEPSHFLDWLKARDPATHSGTFASRRVYGEYLEELLRLVSHPGAPVELVRDEIVELRSGSLPEDRLFLKTASGRAIGCDRVVLALGNQPPLDPTGVEASPAVKHYAANPWGSSLLEGLSALDPLALIGSGLTAVDVIVEAHARGHRGKIHAISRHGLLPCRHQQAPPRPHFDLKGEGATARTLLRSFRAATASCQAEGGDWRSVVDGLRPVAQSLWRSLESRERQRFVRHLAPRWDVHRHRLAPEIDDLVQSQLHSQRLVVVAGRVLGLQERGGGIALSYQRRGCTDTEMLYAARVINCTGPARDIRKSASTLLRSLFSGGMVRPGPLALGLDVSESGALIRSDGRIHDRLFAVGPMLKEQLWETTAVRELRTQAEELARHLLTTSCVSARTELV